MKGNLVNSGGGYQTSLFITLKWFLCLSSPLPLSGQFAALPSTWHANPTVCCQRNPAGQPKQWARPLYYAGMGFSVMHVLWYQHNANMPEVWFQDEHWSTEDFHGITHGGTFDSLWFVLDGYWLCWFCIGEWSNAWFSSICSTLCSDFRKWGSQVA